MRNGWKKRIVCCLFDFSPEFPTNLHVGNQNASSSLAIPTPPLPDSDVAAAVQGPLAVPAPVPVTPHAESLLRDLSLGPQESSTITPERFTTPQPSSYASRRNGSTAAVQDTPILSPVHFPRPPLTTMALSSRHNPGGDFAMTPACQPTAAQIIQTITPIRPRHVITDENIDPALLALAVLAPSSSAAAPDQQGVQFSPAFPRFAPSPPHFPHSRPAPNPLNDDRAPRKQKDSEPKIKKAPARGRGRGRGGGRGGRGGGRDAQGRAKCSDDGDVSDVGAPEIPLIDQEHNPTVPPRPRPRPRPRPVPVPPAMLPETIPSPALPKRSRVPPRLVDGSYAPQASITAAQSAAALAALAAQSAVSKETTRVRGAKGTKRKRDSNIISAEKRQK